MSVAKLKTACLLLNCMSVTFQDGEPVLHPGTQLRDVLARNQVGRQVEQVQEHLVPVTARRTTAAD